MTGVRSAAVTSEPPGAAAGPTRRAGLTVLAGSGAGFGLALLLTPVLSRLYAPSVYGMFTAVAALAAIFVGVSTFRLEVLSQRVTDAAEASRLRQLALVAALGWGLAVSVLTGVVVLLLGASRWWLATGPLVTVASLQLVGSAAWTRERRYRALASANLAQGAGAAVLQVALGWIAGSVGALLAGFAAGRLAWLPALHESYRVAAPNGRGSRQRLAQTWRESRGFAATSGGAAALNSIGGQLPVLLGAGLFGQAEVGFLAMAIRLLVAPLGVVGQAAAAANAGEAGRLLRDRDPTVAVMVRKGMRDLFAVGVLPCVVAGVAGGWLVPVLLGVTWAPAGPLLAWLALGTLAQVTVSPFSQLLNLTGRHRWLLIWDAARMVLVGLTFGIPAALGQPLVVAVAAYSVGLVVLYGVLGWLCLAALRRP